MYIKTKGLCCQKKKGFTKTEFEESMELKYLDVRYIWYGDKELKRETTLNNWKTTLATSKSSQYRRCGNDGGGSGRSKQYRDKIVMKYWRTDKHIDDYYLS